MKRTCIVVTAAMGLLAVTGGNVLAGPLLAPGDFILGIDLEGDGSQGGWPGGESPGNAIDGVISGSSKYLNFGKENSGLIVTPAFGSSTVQSLVFTTGGDAEPRDPASYELYGTNDAVVSQNDWTGLGESWTLISSGALSLPADRLATGAPVDFVNANAYTAYKLLFPTVKNAGGANSMQITEIQLYTGAGGTGSDVFAAGDPVVGIDGNLSPPAESVANAIDGNPGTKYLNFAKQNSGFIVTLSGGPEAVRTFQMTTANDAESRDPTSWALYGTNDAIMSANDSLGDGETWTLIDSGLVDLPLARGALGPYVQVDSNTAYASYRMIFPTQRDPAAGNADSMQYAEIQFYSESIPEPATIGLAAIALLTCAIRFRSNA